jgi:hypothetical protein
VGDNAGLVCNTATGQCEPCTSYTQCGSTSQLGHLACIAGRCRGGEACTSNAQCFVPLVCSQAEGNICVIGNQCDAINPCDDNPIYPICVLRLCTNECIAGAAPAPPHRRGPARRDSACRRCCRAAIVARAFCAQVPG